MQITLSRVVEAARHRKAAVTAEAGGYIVLLAVQRLAAQSRLLDAELIQLTATGEILIDASGPASAEDAEVALRHLLATLVGLSHTAPPALRAAAARPPGGGLRALETELTAALIPINHAASGRALARLFRETEKALRGGPSASVAPTSASAAPDSGTAPIPSAVPVSSAASAASAAPASNVAPTPSAAPVSSAASVSSAVPVSAASAAASTPVAPSSVQRGTPVPERVSWPEPVPSSGPISPMGIDPQLEASSLDIDVELDASDEPEESPAATKRGPELPRTAPPAPSSRSVRSRAPQLLVEELDELDVQALESEPPEPLHAPVPDVYARAAAEAGSSTLTRDEPAAEAQEVAHDLDVLLASELPPPLPAPVPEQLGVAPLDGLPVSGEVGGEEGTPASPLPDSPAAAPANLPAEARPQRSDVRELLEGFLAHTRCEEEMTANLRRLIGLEPWVPSRPSEGTKMGTREAPGGAP